jgi:hypothetical protein
MAPAARVTSVEALVDFKARLVKFGTEAGNALANLQLQIRRTYEWLEDQLEYWQWQLRQRQEEVTRAKSELLQRQYAPGAAAGRGPGCTDQKIAFEEALDAVEEAETKIRNCKHWRQILPREVMECEGPARQLGGMLELDFRRAVALLEQKILALEEYLALTATSGAGAAAGPAPAAPEAAEPPAPAGEPAKP